MCTASDSTAWLSNATTEALPSRDTVPVEASMLPSVQDLEVCAGRVWVLGTLSWLHNLARNEDLQQVTAETACSPWKVVAAGKCLPYRKASGLDRPNFLPIWLKVALDL